MTRNLFEGKNVLVVGGNSGIGLAAAKAFSQEGANLIITGRNVETLTSKADEIGGRTSAYQCDVTDMEQIKDLVVKVELEFGYIDVLFISAGQYSSGSINSVTEENWDWLMDTNLKGMFFTIQGMLPLMGNPSSIVLMGSIAGRLAVAESPVYAASKAGIRLYLVQPTDVVNRLCDQRPVFFQGIHVLPSAMCPTADQSDSFHLLKLFVSCIAIALHNATVAFQQFTGYHTRTAATVIMEHDVPRDAIAYAPLIPLFRLMFLIVHHRNDTLVHLHIITGEYLLFEQVVQQLAFLHRHFIPSAHGRFAYANS